MGSYLSAPRREKTSWAAETHKVYVAVAAMQASCLSRDPLSAGSERSK